MPTISVIMPCYNEENYLGLVLGDLTKQTLQPLEVIVVDGKSEDKTVAVAKSWHQKLPIRVIYTMVRTPGGGRNAGAKVAKGEYLLFIDADIRLPQTFLEQINTSLQRKPVDYITPRWRSNGHLLFDVWLMAWCNAAQWIGAHLTRKPFGLGGAMCVKATTYRKINGFSEKRWAHEDLDFTKRLGQAGASFTYASHIVATYSDRSTRKDGVLSAWVKTNLSGDSWIAQHIALPVLRFFGKTIRYGDYDR